MTETIMEKVKEKVKSWWPPWPFSAYGPWKKPPQEKKPFTWKGEFRDWLVAFIVAAVAYFVVLPLLLGTSAPMVVVSSCSEKGYLNIGDVLVLKGVAIEDVNAPEVYVSKFTGFTPVYDGDEVTAIVVGNDIVSLNRSSDIIVYVAWPSRAQIIHRVFAKIKTDKGYLLITKGDANSIPDQMSSNGAVCIAENPQICISTPVTQQTLVGKSIFGIPFLGHIKLFFCDITFGLLCEGHSNVGTNYHYVLNC